MNTAAAMASGASGAGPGINFGVVAAIIRKDLRALGPFALALGLTMLIVSAFFHEVDDYPGVRLRFGEGQLDVDGLLFLCSVTFLPIAGAIFIVMLVQQDRATDARHDWLSRPIRAGEIVLAKVLVVAAVVMAPSIVGNSFYVMNNIAPIDHLIGPVFTAFMGCVVFLVLGWLCSGPMQALLAPIILALASLAIFIPVARVMSPAADVLIPVVGDEVVVIPETPPAPADAAASVDAAWAMTLTLLASVMIVALLASAVVLWLLLERRQVLRARLAFLGFFVVTVLVFAVQTVVIESSGPRITFQPTQADRMAAFDQHDVNGDRRLTRREYSLLMQAMGRWDRSNRYWPLRDANKDGFLSRDEYELPMADAPVAAATDDERLAAFSENDANGDGRLDKTEYSAVLKQLGFLAQLEPYWAQRDKDKDGFITDAEYKPPIQ